MNLDPLLQIDLMREEALERGREHLAGLEEWQIMTLQIWEFWMCRSMSNHNVLQEVWYDRALRPFVSAYPRCGDPVFILLFQGNYYGIKNVEG